MSKAVFTEKYQVWITDYVLDGDDPASKHDNGYQLVACYGNIRDAAECFSRHSKSKPYITKVVTFRTEVYDITEALEAASRKETSCPEK